MTKECVNSNYEKAKRQRDILQKKVDESSEHLDSFREYRNAMGVLPEWIRESDIYKCAKRNYDKHFKNLQNFNKVFVKKYKKELRKERLNKW